MKNVSGYFSELNGEKGKFYKIENYDCMEDFFMTITSSSDIWNFCWAQGGLTAGRIDCNHAIFPYYTADKVSDAKSYTGTYTAILVEKEEPILWEPFSSLSASPAIRKSLEKNLNRNIYKNTTGTEIWFEEINNELNLSFRYGWTSSAKYGLVRKSVITNLSDRNVSLKILDGCRNILPACVTADFQNENSVLLDAYKKTDLDEKSNLALFAVSSIVTDKAEPSEGLFANTCWFSTDDKIILNPQAPNEFVEDGQVQEILVVKGKRPAAYICKSINLCSTEKSSEWYQLFETNLDAGKIAQLKAKLSNKTELVKDLKKDIEDGKILMQTYINEADGHQETAETMTCVHHSENVMFNIMRGGFFANNGKINIDDFVKFLEQRNKSIAKIAQELISKNKDTIADKENFTEYEQLEQIIQNENNPQLARLFYEYMPLTFSRRHGDPSRPWNKFNIHLQDNFGNQILNYEGNWRDIFQNWEALAWSYPMYIKNMTAKFLNAMTIEGFNPYRISRDGIDWETPDPNNPWAQIGYWGDHQVIYLQKLLELYAKINKEELISQLNDKIFSSSNVPYRIKSYKEIYENPRNTILFDTELSDSLKKSAKKIGSDAKLISADGTAGSENTALVSLSTKLLQIVIAKMANFVPGGGIWLNTQRPEWNDANNALAGYGLSMVTLYYLHRYIDFLIELYKSSTAQSFELPSDIANCFVKLGNLYKETSVEKVASDSKLRKEFMDKEGKIFEEERNNLYKNAYGNQITSVQKDEIVSILQGIQNHIKTTISLNKKDDGLYHSYNTLLLYEDRVEIKFLQEMLEGQVAVLSAGILKSDEVLNLLKALRSSKMYEPRQNSYMLYPNKELASFEEKNNVSKDDVKDLSSLLEKTGKSILYEDCNGVFHFNGSFRNEGFMIDFCAQFPDNKKVTEKELEDLKKLYEKTFNHNSFTGRSGTFFAYEGLGSIYWHMVSKLLLATQENTFAAIKNEDKKSLVEELTNEYYNIRSGIGFNKTPELYGAFPADPYSHTPNGQGAKQPGMTGQVKEEILTRWGELGVDIQDGCAYFNPKILKKSEFFDNNQLHFTWCNTHITYKLVPNVAETLKICVNGTTRAYEAKQGAFLTKEETAQLFSRNGKLCKIEVEINL